MRALQPLSLWRSANFQKYMAGRLLGSFATDIVIVTVGWQIYSLTRDPLYLGFVGLSLAAPIFLFSLFAGLAADRLNRRAIIATSYSIHALAAGFILYYGLSGSSEPWPIFLAVFLHGSAKAFEDPSTSSILPNLMNRKRFPTAVAYVHSFEKVTEIAAPALAGVLIAIIGVWVYLIAVVCFAVSAVFAAFLKPQQSERESEAIDLSELIGGFSYVWRNKLVLAVMTMDLVAVIFSGVLGMLPAFALDVLDVGPEGLGIMRMMPAVGAVAVGLLLVRLPLKENVGRTLIASVICIGISVIAFSLSEIFWLSLLFLALYGAADMVSTNIRNTLVQLVTPDDMRGRVASVHSVTAGSSDELGDFRAGAAAAVIGLVPAVAIGGVITISLSLAWWWIFPAMRNVNMYGER